MMIDRTRLIRTGRGDHDAAGATNLYIARPANQQQITPASPGGIRVIFTVPSSYNRDVKRRMSDASIATVLFSPLLVSGAYAQTSGLLEGDVHLGKAAGFSRIDRSHYPINVTAQDRPLLIAEHHETDFGPVRFCW